ncbi:xanthine dehydrogenase family protein molybdopterin-binding subunit [Siphonobacter curvatus]|uniref:Xanthine dehydrogenase family protein molybdopterin-binding subunit n=1 Tax=Siphonobacter curvatus TaxID=2094562 RepID=A0A2S7IIM2_9BACT|nr:molybdopterin cofactor-binding domain-containing protein [Siphonobacter curvatus]PQA55707.1 xanthine dehydrogenase family protein molybdopterin-binding subunit [Siphonobacter curvatus]
MHTSRRDFLKTMGTLTIGFTLPSWVPEADELPGSLQRDPRIRAWLEILENGQIRVFTGKMELGQGIRTAVAQVAAEELNLPLSQVEVVMADTDRTPDESYTAGSASIENSAMAVRYAAAAARQKLLELAAKQWRKPVEELQFAAGTIRWKNKQISWKELLNGKQLQDEVRGNVALKPKEEYQLVGKPMPRPEINRMVRAETWFIQDLRLPGMVHARMVRPPSYGARLEKLDESNVRKQIPGIQKVVVQGSLVGVIATEEFQAMQAQWTLQESVRWTDVQPLPTGTALVSYLKSLPARIERVHEKGQPTGPTTIKAQYFKPYLMHGSIGPSCALAWYQKGTLRVWSHSQGVFPLRETLHRLLKLPLDRIHVIGMAGSGCYGHNGADDVAAEAAWLAMAYPEHPIRLQWSRDEEHAWEPYGSAMILEAEARLSTTGRIEQWNYTLWSDTYTARPGGDPANLLLARYLDPPIPKKPASSINGGTIRNSEPYYRIPDVAVDAHQFEGPLRVSSLRALGAFGNVFAIESFMDELAEKAEKDPFEFRIMHLEDERAIAVLRRLQELIQNERIKPKEGVGIAFARYKNTAAYCAVAARVRITGDQIQVMNLWSVIDAGEVINPDGLKNQTEGGLIQAASWTLKEQVQFDAQQITSRDWVSYPIFRMSEIPEVEVVVIDRPQEPVLGAGEAVQGPTAAALANALYRASGKRVRDLPLVPAKLKS